MAELKCTVCEHTRRMHSFMGCEHRGKTKAEDCKCPVAHSDKDSFK